MSDPFEALRTPRPTQAPPAAEIRRRGDVRRRRATLASSLAGVAAVAAVAIPMGLGLGGSDRSVPPVTGPPSPTRTVTEPSPQWLTTVPKDFDLLAGWDASVGKAKEVPRGASDPGPWFQGIPNLCGSSLDFTPGSTDIAMAEWTTEGDYLERRTLLLFPDSVAASSSLKGVMKQVGLCDQVTATETQLNLDIRNPELGYNSWGLKLDTHASGTWFVFHYGNALLFASGYTSGGTVNQDTFHQTAGLVSDSAAAVTDQMCVFTSAGCAGTHGTNDATDVVPRWDPSVHSPDLSGGSATALDDLPITDGFPSSHEPGTDGLQQPSPTTTVDLTACGDRFRPKTAPTDGLRAAFYDVEYARQRSVLVFPDTASADAWVTELSGFYADCPVETPDAEGNSMTHAVIDLPVGDRGIAVRSVSASGHKVAGTGQDVVTAVRFGSAVVVDYKYGEGAYGDQSQMLQDQVDSSATLLAAVRATYAETRSP